MQKYIRLYLKNTFRNDRQGKFEYRDGETARVAYVALHYNYIVVFR